ncbi:zinc finger protein 346 [Spea bombifrons]|uniref:zinc finger protein 346 n=1 Tax=Spea bombifrons TaxID=233779 RepID=UPI00234A7CB4|nr:zinc finger protein 346 [Spea bombifrons]
MADGVGNGDDLDLPVGKEAVDRLIRENSDIFSETQCKVCSAALISESQKLAHYQSKKHANKVRRYKAGNQWDDPTPPKRMKTTFKVQDSDSEDSRNKVCSICNMTFTSAVVAQSHYLGKTHAKNLKIQMQGGVAEVDPPVKKPVKTPVQGPKVDDKVDENDPEKFCKLCKATFNNPLMSQQHYMGKKHKKQETKTQLMTIYTIGNSLPQTADIKPAIPGSVTAGKGYSCDICRVVLNSIEQYQAHISGSKHKNQLNTMVTTDEGTLNRKSAGHYSASKGFSSSKSYKPAGGYQSSLGTSSSRDFSSSNFTSSGGFSSTSSYLPSGGYSSSRGFSSTGGFSSGDLMSAGSYSSSGRYLDRSGTMGGLLPSPYSSVQHNQPYVRDMIRPDGYNYFN